MKTVRVTFARKTVSTFDCLLSVPDEWDLSAIRKWASANEDELLERAEHEYDYEDVWELQSRDSTNVESVSAVSDDDWCLEEERFVAEVDSDGVLKAYSPPYSDPDFWSEWRGHQWATDLAMVMREDGPRPSRPVQWHYFDPSTVESLFTGCSFAPALFVGRIKGDSGSEMRIYKTHDGTPFAACAWRTVEWDELTVGIDKNKGLFVGERNGEMVVALMQMKMSDRVAEEARRMCR